MNLLFSPAAMMMLLWNKQMFVIRFEMQRFPHRRRDERVEALQHSRRGCPSRAPCTAGWPCSNWDKASHSYVGSGIEWIAGLSVFLVTVSGLHYP